MSLGCWGSHVQEHQGEHPVPGPHEPYLASGWERALAYESPLAQHLDLHVAPRGRPSSEAGAGAHTH